MVNNLCQKVIFSTDALIIGIFLPASSVTFYAIAGNLIEYLRQITRVAADVLNPLTSELSAKKESEKIKDVLIQGTKLGLLMGLPIVTVYLIMGRQFISLWMGPQYAKQSGDVLIVLSLAQILSFPHYTVNSLLYGISRHNIIANLRVFEAVMNLVLSIILVKYMGILGVALATVIPHVLVVTIILPVVISRIVDLNLWTYIRCGYLGPLTATIPFVIVCYWINKFYPMDSLSGFFAEVVLMLPFYLMAAWALGFNRRERRYYWSVIKPLVPGMNRS